MRKPRWRAQALAKKRARKQELKTGRIRFDPHSHIDVREMRRLTDFVYQTNDGVLKLVSLDLLRSIDECLSNKRKPADFEHLLDRYRTLMAQIEAGVFETANKR